MRIVNLKQAPQHLAQLASWHYEEWGHLYPGMTLRDRMVKMQAYLNDDFVPSTFVAIDGDKVLGSAAIVERDMEDRPELTPWLASVFVAPENRNRGIGGQLVRHVMQQTRDHGKPSLYLFTPDQQAFYRKLGWQDFEQVEYCSMDVTIMQAVLI